MSKTVSARISNGMHEELRERCNNLGCTIDEYVTESIKVGLDGASDFEFDVEEDEPELIEPKSRTFTCKDGILYEDGIKFGNCSEFDLNQGRVSDKNGNFLGIIDNS